MEWVDLRLEHPLQKVKVLGSSSGWVKTFQKCGMGSLAVRASAAKVEDPGFKSRLGEHFSKHVAWVDLRLEYLPQKWKVPDSSPGRVNTFQKCGMG